MGALLTGRRGIIISASLFLIAIALVVLRHWAVIHASHPSAGVGSHGGMPTMLDFQLAVYYATKAFVAGVNPYDRVSFLAHYPVSTPFAPYLPTTFLLHLPFAFLPLTGSAILYFVLQLALVIVLAAVSLRYNGQETSGAAVLLVAALIVLSIPGRKTLLLGQLTLQAVLGSYVALHYARRSPVVSGLGLAFTMFKPSFGLPLAVLMLARRDTRAVIIGAAVTAAANLPLLAILAHQSGGYQPLATDVIQTFRANQVAWAESREITLVLDPATSNYRIDAVTLLSRFLGHPLGGAAQLLTALVVLGAAAVALRVGAGADSTHDPYDVVSTSIICVAMLFAVYHLNYDLLLLTLPAVALARGRLPVELRPPRRRWVLLALLTVLAVNPGSSNSLLVHLHLVDVSRITSPLAHAVWLMLVSTNALVLLILLCMLVTLRLRGAAAHESGVAGGVPAIG
jgi:hypothetical protein